MRYFFRSRIPEPRTVLLVESGSRSVMEKAYARMTPIFSQARFELCTCFPGVPAPGGFERVYRVTEATDAASKWNMLLAMRRSRPPVAALLFTTDPILFRWKLLLMLLLPSKLLVVNENADFFWLDWSNRDLIRRFLGARLDVEGAELLRAAFRLLLFPFAFTFLACYALFAYLGRWLRLLSWSLSRRS